MCLQDADDVTVLLMDDTGAVGLDLSFVEYVFLMDPLENASMEEQIIARAHRMGATANVHVETLIMRVRVKNGWIPCVRPLLEVWNCQYLKAASCGCVLQGWIPSIISFLDAFVA